MSLETLAPAEISDDYWAWRWQYCPTDGYERLHRMAVPFQVGRKAAWRSHRAVSVCGLPGQYEMPGVISRLGRPRCSTCCQIVGIPTGDGAPYNTKGASWKSV